MRVARVPDGSIAYRAAGDAGPLLLLLHGSFGSAAAWKDYPEWLAGEGFRVLAPSDRTFVVPDLVADATAFLDAVAPGERVHVVGHSRGGTVGAFLAYELGHPRVASLTVAASPPLASEAFRAAFRPPAGGAPVSPERAYLAAIPDDHFAAELVSQYKGPGLVVEGADDPLYSPTHTMFWRAWFKGASVERAPGGHSFPFDGGEGEAWFRARLLRFLREVA